MELILATLNGIRRRINEDFYPYVASNGRRWLRGFEAAACLFALVWMASGAVMADGGSGRGFIASMFTMETLKIAFIALIAVLFAGVTFIALLRAVFSSRVTFGAKGVLIALVAVIAAQGWVMSRMSANPVKSKEYRFFDMAHSDPSGQKISVDNFVKAEGSWRSDAKTDLPWQTTSLECFRDRGLCVDATVRINDAKQLSIVTTYWEIQEWNASEIRLKDDESALCTADRLRIDRRSEVVTMTRLPKSVLPDACRGMNSDPITMFLDFGVSFAKQNA